jgi:hypothetical protein
MLMVCEGAGGMGCEQGRMAEVSGDSPHGAASEYARSLDL